MAHCHAQLAEKAAEWVAQIQRLQEADLLINEDTGWRLCAVTLSSPKCCL